MGGAQTAAPLQPEIGRRRDFWLVFSGQAVSMQGDGLAGLALLWWIAQDTGSVSVAATLTLATTLPVIFLGPVAGTIIDRFSRRLVMMVTDLVRAAAAGFLAWAMAGGTLTMWSLVAAATISSAARAFHRPALQASLPQLVPAEGLNRANSLYQIAEAGANLIAPPVGGVLVGLLGSGAVMGLTAATYGLAAITLGFAVIPAVVRTAEKVGAGWRGLLRETGAGLGYLWNGQKMLFFMLVSFALVNFALAPLGPLAPFLAEGQYGLDVQRFGVFMIGLPVGTLLGAGAVSVLGARLRRGMGVIWGVALVGLGQAVLGSVSSLSVGLGALVLMGLAVSVANISSNGLFQTHVPREMQGRVFAVRSSIAQAANPVALALVGVLADVATPGAIVFVGGLLAAAGGLLGFAVPGLAKAT